MTASPELLRWLEEDRRCVAAILVDAEGSAPLAPGSTMLIDESGSVEGSLTGGCVESAVAQEAIQLLAEGPDAAPRMRTYGISDDLAGTAGLMCGGTVHIFLTALTPESARHLAAFHGFRAADRPAGIAILLDGEHGGSTILLAPAEDSDADPEATGTFESGALFDHNVASDLRGLLAKGRTEILHYANDGSRLGSDVGVFVHTQTVAPRMLLVGAVDFSAALAPIASQLGYRVTICDPRPAFAASPRFSRAAEVIVGWPDALFAGRKLEAADVVLVFSHDARLDVPALLAALETDAGYIGALGSRKTTEDRARRLLEAGATSSQIERIFAPVGLDIGGASPEETAISILAEIIATRSGRSGASLRAGGESTIRPRQSSRAHA